MRGTRTHRQHQTVAPAAPRLALHATPTRTGSASSHVPVSYLSAIGDMGRTSWSQKVECSLATHYRYHNARSQTVRACNCVQGVASHTLLYAFAGDFFEAIHPDDLGKEGTLAPSKRVAAEDDIFTYDLSLFAAEDEGKTEEPTERKQRRAREEEGRVVVSQEISATLVLLVGVVIIALLAPYFIEQITALSLIHI